MLIDNDGDVTQMSTDSKIVQRFEERVGVSVLIMCQDCRGVIAVVVRIGGGRVRRADDRMMIGHFQASDIVESPTRVMGPGKRCHR